MGAWRLNAPLYAAVCTCLAVNVRALLTETSERKGKECNAFAHLRFAGRRVAAAGLTGGRVNKFNITKQSKVRLPWTVVPAGSHKAYAVRCQMP